MKTLAILATLFIVLGCVENTQKQPGNSKVVINPEVVDKLKKPVVKVEIEKPVDESQLPPPILYQ